MTLLVIGIDGGTRNVINALPMPLRRPMPARHSGRALADDLVGQAGGGAPTTVIPTTSPQSGRTPCRQRQGSGSTADIDDAKGAQRS